LPVPFHRPQTETPQASTRTAGLRPDVRIDDPRGRTREADIMRRAFYGKALEGAVLPSAFRIVGPATPCAWSFRRKRIAMTERRPARTRPPGATRRPGQESVLSQQSVGVSPKIRPVYCGHCRMRCRALSRRFVPRVGRLVNPCRASSPDISLAEHDRPAASISMSRTRRIRLL
jgi:hypothetical protein